MALEHTTGTTNWYGPSSCCCLAGKQSVYLGQLLKACADVLQGLNLSGRLPNITRNGGHRQLSNERHMTPASVCHNSDALLPLHHGTQAMLHHQMVN